MALVLTNDEVAEALDADGYIEAMEEAFSELGRRAAINSPRTETSVPLLKYGASKELRTGALELLRELPEDADPRHSQGAIRAANAADELNYRLKTMPGGYPKCGLMALRIDSTTDTHPVVNGKRRGVKVPLGPGWRYTGIVILFSLKSGEVLGIFPDGQIQKMRVAATSAVGVKHLSRPDACAVGLLGTGWQAEGQLETVSRIRRLRQVRVFSPDPHHRSRFARKMQDRIGVEVVPVDSPEHACREADLVLCATTSAVPVFKAAWLREGMHLGTVNTKEADLRTFRESDVVAVNVRPFGGRDLVHEFTLGDRRSQTSGKLLNRSAHQLNWKETVEMGAVLARKARGRKKPGDITFHCNNIGLGMQFAAAGARILENARRKGLGREIPTDWFLQKEHT